MALMVFATDAGPLGALVDEIECVARIPSSAIDARAVIRTHIAANYLIGIGNLDGRLISLLDLNKLLGSEELKAAHVVRQ
jgi:purine-binding chemotaxis protein CheW